MKKLFVILILLLGSCYHQVNNHMDYIKHCDGKPAYQMSAQQCRECRKFEDEQGWY